MEWILEWRLKPQAFGNKKVSLTHNSHALYGLYSSVLCYIRAIICSRLYALPLVIDYWLHIEWGQKPTSQQGNIIWSIKLCRETHRVSIGYKSLYDYLVHPRPNSRVKWKSIKSQHSFLETSECVGYLWPWNWEDLWNSSEGHLQPDLSSECYFSSSSYSCRFFT